MMVRVDDLGITVTRPIKELTTVITTGLEIAVKGKLAGGTNREQRNTVRRREGHALQNQHGLSAAKGLQYIIVREEYRMRILCGRSKEDVGEQLDSFRKRKLKVGIDGQVNEERTRRRHLHGSVTEVNSDQILVGERIPTEMGQTFDCSGSGITFHLKQLGNIGVDMLSAFDIVHGKVL